MQAMVMYSMRQVQTDKHEVYDIASYLQMLLIYNQLSNHLNSIGGASSKFCAIYQHHCMVIKFIVSSSFLGLLHRMSDFQGLKTTAGLNPDICCMHRSLARI